MDTYEIIDFHTHPFFHREDNICRYPAHCDMAPANIRRDLERAGIRRMCGSVIRTKQNIAQVEGIPPEDLSDWDVIAWCNADMCRFGELLGDFYIPGMMVHGTYPEESCREMERLYAKGVRLVGELVPYYHGWRDYSCRGFLRILECARELGMIVSIHSMDDDQMDGMADKNPGATVVFAHPNEYPQVMRHIARLKKHGECYLDISGTGIFRYGMLRAMLDEVGRNRVLFGSDYPVCNPYLYVGGISADPMLSREEKQAIFAGNARRLFAGVGLTL